MNTTRFDLGGGVRMEVESYDQLPAEVRQEVRKLGMQLVEALAPHSATLVRVGAASTLERGE